MTSKCSSEPFSVSSVLNILVDFMGSRLFIASVGNPAPYTNTLHSAGHHVLESLRRTWGYPPFQRNISVGDRHTLFRCPAYMNVSGPPIIKAFKEFARSGDGTDQLIILHDELELPLGQYKKRESGSLKGHNGLKSVSSSLGGKDFTRIGIGIGRPDSRSSKDVSDYVLGQMTSFQKDRLESAADGISGLLV